MIPMFTKLDKPVCKTSNNGIHGKYHTTYLCRKISCLMASSETKLKFFLSSSFLMSRVVSDMEKKIYILISGCGYNYLSMKCNFNYDDNRKRNFNNYNDIISTILVIADTN